jgi:hypothetical protein
VNLHIKRNWNYIKALLEQIEQANRKGVLQEHALNVALAHDIHDPAKKEQATHALQLIVKEAFVESTVDASGVETLIPLTWRGHDLLGDRRANVARYEFKHFH